MSKIEADILRARVAAFETPMLYPVRGSAKSFGRVGQIGTHVVASGALNISSVVDIGTAYSTINFAANFVNGNFAVSGASEYTVTAYTQFQFTGALVNSVNLLNSPDASNAFTDGVLTYMCMGDLA